MTEMSFTELKLKCHRIGFFRMLFITWYSLYPSLLHWKVIASCIMRKLHSSTEEFLTDWTLASGAY